MPSDRLDTRRRADTIDALASTVTRQEPLDVLVVGGGITGAGVAVDAATRGLSVGIIEADDWASGTSSRSSNLVHGGLRYLQMLDFRLVWEALGERELLLHHIAPHLVKPQPFLFPLEHRWWQRVFIGLGVALYDLMATVRRGRRSVPVHTHRTRTGLLRRFPSLRRSAFVGAIEYWDATIDDAAMVTALVRTAVGHGAHAVTRARLVETTHDASGRVDGARIRDMTDGSEFTVKARNVIVATGVWTERTEELVGGSRPLQVLASKGVHISVPRSAIDGDSAIIHQTATSVLFLIPFEHTWVIGTTDTPWNHEERTPVATAADIEYLLDEANSILEHPIGRDDIIGFWAGLRPLVEPAESLKGTPSKVSREHTVVTLAPGVTAIAGGKLTTYRVMAEDAVDVAIGKRAASLPSVSDRVVIVGSDGLEDPEVSIADLRTRFGWGDPTARRLARRYGSRMREIAQLCADDPDLAKSLENAPDHLRVEVVHAIVFEGAMTLDDVIRRRTRMSREIKNLGIPVIDEVASLVAATLGWDDAFRDAAADDIRNRLEAEIAASFARDDHEAISRLVDSVPPHERTRSGRDALSEPSKGKETHHDHRSA